MDAQIAAFDLDGHARRLADDGYTIIEDFISPADLVRVREALAPFQESHRGRNAFEGFLTERVYTLVARGKVFEEITAEPRLLALLGRFLQPNFLLTASQSICIHPGETAQSLHTDDGFYRVPRPRAAISLSVVAAIDAFTAENGATDIIPGSHRWGPPEERAGREAEVEAMARPAVMPAGAAIVFQGTLIHRGGANRSDRPRLAITNQYCEPWARTQENFFLGVPREQVRGMSPELQSLLGYSIWPSFMGQVTGSHPLKALEPGWVSPVERQSAGG